MIPLPRVLERRHAATLSPRPARWWALALTLAICAVAIDSANADPVLDKAATLLKTGKADAAAAVYDAYLRTHPDDLAAQLGLAEIAMRRFDYEEARGILESTLARHPEAPEVAARLGRLYQQWSNIPGGRAHYKARAQEHFSQALASGSQNPVVLAMVGDWQIEQDDMVSAERNLNKALQLAPGYIPAYHGLIRFYMKARDTGRARDVALHALELDPVNAETYFWIARLLGQASQPVQAVQYALKAEQLDFGRNPNRDFFLATQYEKLGQLPQALQYYQTLVGYTPDDPDSWVKIAEIQDRLNQREESLAAYRKAIALKPELISGMQSQARDNTRAEKIELALGQWRRLIDLSPTEPELIGEALESMASLHLLNTFYTPNRPNPGLADDAARMQRFAGMPGSAADTPARQLAGLKLAIAQAHGVSPTIHAQLLAMGNGNDALSAGEALFLAGRTAEAKDRLEDFSPMDAPEALRAADRLLLDQELAMSKSLYQQAHQMAPDPRLQEVVKRIQAKQNLAAQRVTDGDALFALKDFEGAVGKYREASRIDRENNNAYLRLADALQQLKRWPEALTAYDRAVALSPSLMDSPGFAKNYDKIKKKAASAKPAAPAS